MVVLLNALGEIGNLKGNSAKSDSTTKILCLPELDYVTFLDLLNYISLPSNILNAEIKLGTSTADEPCLEGRYRGQR